MTVCSSYFKFPRAIALFERRLFGIAVSFGLGAPGACCVSVCFYLARLNSTPFLKNFFV